MKSSSSAQGRPLTTTMNFPKDNLFTDIHKRLRLLPGLQGLNSVSQLEQSTQTPGSASPVDQVRRDAEIIATDVVHSFGREDERKPPNRYCKTMRRTVRELSDRHDVTFKGMVTKLNISEENAFPTFVNVADEIFMDGKINWGRIVAVFTFAARLSQYCRENQMSDYADKIALFAGKYVGNKLGHWINDNGGWVRNGLIIFLFVYYSLLTTSWLFDVFCVCCHHRSFKAMNRLHGGVVRVLTHSTIND